MLSGEYGFPSYCDYIEAQTVQKSSGEPRGTYRYIHAQGASDYWVDISAGPDLPRTDAPIGSTTADSNCQGGWEGYHTHQDADSPYSTPNPNLPVDDDIPVWDVSYYIHKWTFPDPELDVKYALLFGPAPVNLSDQQGRFMWVLAPIENQTSVDRQAKVSLSVTGVPGACDRIQQLILPGQETFPIAAGQTRWVIYRERYECHAPASPGVYPLQVETCVREADHSFDYDCEEDAKALIVN